LYSYIFLFIIIIKDRIKCFFHIMKKNEKRCTLHTNFKILMALFSQNWMKFMLPYTNLLKCNLLRFSWRTIGTLLLNPIATPLHFLERMATHIQKLKTRQWLIYTHQLIYSLSTQIKYQHHVSICMSSIHK